MSQTASVRERVRQIIRSDGLAAAQRATGLGREQCLRLAADVPVRRGTELVAAENLSRCDSETTTP